MKKMIKKITKIMMKKIMKKMMKIIRKKMIVNCCTMQKEGSLFVHVMTRHLLRPNQEEDIILQ